MYIESDDKCFWWYKCDGDGCSDQTWSVPIFTMPEELRAWKLPDLQNVHLCPKCRAKYAQK